MKYLIRWSGAKGLDFLGKSEGDMWLMSLSEDRKRAAWTPDKDKARRFDEGRELNEVWCVWPLGDVKVEKDAGASEGAGDE